VRIALFDLTESMLIKKLVREAEETSNEALQELENL
jgi:hypothetical protein